MIAGDRVCLRAPQEDDLDALYAIASDLDTWEQRSPDPPSLVTRTAYEARFRSALEADDNTGFVIDVDGAVAGRCGSFDHSPLTRSCEVGIALGAQFRGRGLGTESMRLLVGFCFERRNEHRIHLSALASNAAALASYRKVGFREEGRLRESAWVRGRYEDEVVMGLLRSEWRALSG